MVIVSSLNRITAIFLLLKLLKKLGELGVGVSHQSRRLVIFQDLSEGEDQYSVTLDDGVQAMRNGDHGRVTEFLRDQSLDRLFCHHINVGCGFVQDDDSAFLQEC